MEFVRKAHRERSVRLVGICFGHQIIARALGSKIGRNIKGWELSVGEVQLTDVGKKLFGKDILVRRQSHGLLVLKLLISGLVRAVTPSNAQRCRPAPS